MIACGDSGCHSFARCLCSCTAPLGLAARRWEKIVRRIIILILSDQFIAVGISLCIICTPVCTGGGMKSVLPFKSLFVKKKEKAESTNWVARSFASTFHGLPVVSSERNFILATYFLSSFFGLAYSGTWKRPGVAN